MLSGCTKILIATTVMLFVGGCGLLPAKNAREDEPKLGFDAAVARKLWLHDRPRVVSITGSGGRLAVLGFAGRTDSPPVANFALALILKRRLSDIVSTVDASASSFGLSLASLVEDARQAAVASRMIHSILSAPIRSEHVDAAILTQLKSQFSQQRNSTPGEIALARCSGEVYRDPQQAEAIANHGQLVAWIEAARRQMYTRTAAVFSVVGSREFALSVQKSIDRQPPWPQEIQKPTHELDSKSSAFAVTSGSGPGWGLTYAWTVGSLDEAVSAWHQMRSPGSPLLARLSAMDTEWRIDSISTVARPTGACLRIELEYSNAGLGPTSSDIERISRLVAHETRIALQQAQNSGPAASLELSDSDARLAARRAAWQSLSIDAASNVQAKRAYLRVPATAVSNSELNSALKTGLTRRTSAPIELRSAMESGHDEQWVLLASPCGTGAELTKNAGSTAAWIRSLAKRYSGQKGVFLEPWISSSAIGLLAHSRPQHPAETVQDTSTRIGNSLGSVLATGSVTGSDLAILREATLVQLGTSPRRGWWELLETLAPQHPALFEPWGTFDSVRHWSGSDLKVSGRRWLREPLRIAMLTNRDRSQAKLVGTALDRWLEPMREKLAQCERPPAPSIADSDLQMTPPSTDPSDPSAYVAIRLHGDSTSSADYDQWFEWLLNRPNGWLDQLLIEPNVSKTAHARIQGPRDRRVLFLDFDGVDSTSTTEVLARMRSLLARLNGSGLSIVEFNDAREWARRFTAIAELNPRKRLVDLWSGATRSPKPTKVAFSHYLVESLTSAPVTVLRVRK